MNKLLMAAVAGLMISSAWAVEGTIYTASDTTGKRGKITWQSRPRTYTVSVKKGATMVDLEVKADDVTRLDVAEPKELQVAIDQVNRGQASAAIPTLSRIVQEYRMLNWDKPAARYLVEAYLAANNAQKAYETAESVVREDKTAAYVGELAPAYWQALLKLGKTQALELNLKRAAAVGDRAAAAAALVMRGDMILAEGDTPENHRKALTDGYLRVVLMYRDELCKEARTAALSKAAASFDRLGMASRAEDLRAQVKSL